jgi:hypothetical protein
LFVQAHIECRLIIGSGCFVLTLGIFSEEMKLE